MLTMTRWGGLVRAWEAVNGYRYFFKGTGGQTPLASKAERTFPPKNVPTSSPFFATLSLQCTEQASALFLSGIAKACIFDTAPIFFTVLHVALWRVETPRGTWRKRAADATKYTLGNATNATELVVWQPFPENDRDSAGAARRGG